MEKWFRRFFKGLLVSSLILLAFGFVGVFKQTDEMLVLSILLIVAGVMFGSLAIANLRDKSK